MEKQRWQESENRKSQQKEHADARKEKSRKTLFSQCDSRGSGAEPFREMRYEKFARLCGAKLIWKSKMRKTPCCRSIFEGSDVESLHASMGEHISKSK